ncbi:hypothetical protein TSL6_16650 [Sulfurovum sp. TSL6]|uniref:hypothetical protein n=1 Tax=Sulfurovum sp. TSL6 TaxID=2826995 RepID=UPI001CC5C618|nr:hypothetical protein [Sulfurovum sp. TSL6]GIU01159.1 hypothetical protein TSL6_16650 [Sulfurovum sp. TSL6]
MKKLNALLAIIAMSFMVGCGGGSGAGIVSASGIAVDPMTERDLIEIFYHTPTGMCEDPDFQQYLKDELASQGFFIDYYLFREETNTVDCTTYDRTNDINDGCLIFDLAILLDDPNYLNYDTSCVIGVDFDPNAQPVAKDTNIDASISSAIKVW